MKISLSDFILLTLSVFVGTLGAIALAGWYAEKKASAAIAAARADARANNPLLGLIGF